MSERRYALLIGNQSYPEPSDFTPLNCPHADVDALQAVLEDPERGAFHEIETLKDADRSETMKAIGTALRQKDRDDLLLIYFSGHGKTDDFGDLYLATNNSEKEHLQATAIDARQLSQMMGRADAGKTVLILDCCHAGAFPTGFKSGDGLQTVVDSYARGGGCYVLMACGEFELARDGETGALSHMTGHLVAGLQGEADVNSDGRITVKELSDYLDQSLAVGGAQNFHQSGRNQQGDVLLSMSGIDPLEDVLQAAEQQVIAWCEAGTVSRRVRNEVLAFTGSSPDPADGDVQMQLDAIRGVAEGRLSAGEFSDTWVRATTANTAISKAPAPVTAPPEQQHDYQPGLSEAAAPWKGAPDGDVPVRDIDAHEYGAFLDDPALSPPFIVTAAAMVGLTGVLWLVTPWIFWGFGWAGRDTMEAAGGMFMGLVFVLSLLISIGWVLLFENQRSNGVQFLKLCLRTVGLWMFTTLSYEILDPTGVVPFIDAWLDAP